MDPLPHEPRTFREIVEADLRRAARLIIKVQDEIEPQWRIATPTGDWHIAATVPADAEGRAQVLRAIATFLVWKDAKAFTMAAELSEPADTLYCVGLSPAEAVACATRIARAPKPWTKASFTAPEWLPPSAIDPVLIDLLPKGPRALTPKEVSAMAKWFGRRGRFPALNLATGEIGA